MAKVHVRVKSSIDGYDLLSAREYAERVAENARVAQRKTARDFGRAVERAMQKANSRARRARHDTKGV